MPATLAVHPESAIAKGLSTLVQCPAKESKSISPVAETKRGGLDFSQLIWIWLLYTSRNHTSEHRDHDDRKEIENRRKEALAFFAFSFALPFALALAFVWTLRISSPVPNSSAVEATDVLLSVIALS